MLARMNTSPVSLWREFHDEVDSWLAANGQVDSASVWTPAVDVVEEQDSYVLTADLPGVAREDIDIVYEDNVLTIKGARNDTQAQSGYQRVERSQGEFKRCFRVPENIDAERISAKNEHGVLVVNIPKQEVASKKIDVQ